MKLWKLVPPLAGALSLLLVLSACRSTATLPTAGGAATGDAPQSESNIVSAAIPLRHYTPVKLALRDYRGTVRDLVADPDTAVAAGVRSLGGRVDYPSPPIDPTPGYELTLKGPNGEEAFLSYVGDGNWQAASDWVEGKALADAVQTALPTPARQQGNLEYLFGATDLKVTKDGMGIPAEAWNRRRQVVVRVLRDLGTPRDQGSIPQDEPLSLIFTVRGQTELVEVWADVFRYRGSVYQAGQILQTLGSNMSAG